MTHCIGSGPVRVTPYQEVEVEEETRKFLPDFQHGQKLGCGTAAAIYDMRVRKKGGKKMRLSESDVKEWQCDPLLSVGVSQATNRHWLEPKSRPP